MELKRLLEGIPVVPAAEGADPDCGADVKTVSSDSRRASPGCLFVCLRGGRRDGHAFAAEAVGKGALFVLGEYPAPGVPPERMLLTDDTRRAESFLWNNLTGRPTDGMRKIAVTGTAGKTTVTLLISAILRAAGMKTGTLTTVRCEAGGIPVPMGDNGGSSVSDIPGAMTTPDPEYFFGAAAAMRKAGCGAFLYEASSQSLALGKTAAIVPDLAVFTNLSPEHLDFHGTMEAYFQAKASLLRAVREAVISGDPWLNRLPAMFPETSFTVCLPDGLTGEGPDAAPPCREICRAGSVRSLGADGMEYLWISPRAAFRIRTPMPGRFSVVNTMLAAAAALRTGVDPAVVRDAIGGFRGVDGRMCPVTAEPAAHEREPGGGKGKKPAVFIDYAHTPEAMKAALGAVKEFSRGPVTAVFGCGGERDRGKRPAMARTAESLADTVVVTSDNPRGEDPDGILRDILAGFSGKKPAAVIPDRERAVRFAISSAPPDGTVLLFGKGHEKYEITAEGKRPFDEEAVAREALAEYGSASAE